MTKSYSEILASTNRLKICFVSRSCIVFFVFLSAEVGKVASDVKCPVSTGTLYAYPEGDTLSFHDNFNPVFQTKIDTIDNFLFDDVRCEWEVRAKNNHLAYIAVTDFHLLPRSGSDAADCLDFYDGNSKTANLLARLCGGDEAAESYTSSEDRFVLIVYTRGKRTGERSFKLTYKALPRSKDFIIKIAAIVSGSVAALAVIFLAFKFTRCCLPCRKRCCPPTEEDPPQRELRPLNTAVSAPQLANSVDQTASHEMQAANGARQISVPARLTFSGEAVPELQDGEQSPAPDEPPPSYDSIFRQGQEGDKAIMS